jgi:alkyl hydroperoxide reductase subunit AhpF
MAIFTDEVKEQLRVRFQERLDAPVALRLHVRPSSGRLILPSGFGCATCDEARELATGLAEAAPDKLSLDLVDVSAGAAPGVEEVPALQVGPEGEDPRVSFWGLPVGFEFAAVVDVIERVSRAELGLDPTTLASLERVTQPLEVMVFATPT